VTVCDMPPSAHSAARAPFAGMLGLLIRSRTRRSLVYRSREWLFERTRQL